MLSSIQELKKSQLAKTGVITHDPVMSVMAISQQLCYGHLDNKWLGAMFRNLHAYSHRVETELAKLDFVGLSCLCGREGPAALRICRCAA